MSEDSDSAPEISEDDGLGEDILWTIEDFEEEYEARRNARRIDTALLAVRSRLVHRRWSPTPGPATRRKKNCRKRKKRQSCRPRSRLQSQISSRSPSRSPLRSRSASRSRSRTRTRSQSPSPSRTCSPSTTRDTTASSTPPSSEHSSPERKIRSRSPLSRPRSRNWVVTTEIANLQYQTRCLNVRDLNAIEEPEYCLERFIKVFREIHRSITKINRINRDLARQHNITDIWSEYDTNLTFSTVKRWLKAVNDYSLTMDWDVVETIFFAIAELTRCAGHWAASHSTANYKWKLWQAKVVLAYAAFQNFGNLLPEMVYKSSDDEETLEDYYHGKVLALYRCDIEGSKAVACIIHGIRDDEVRNEAKKKSFKCTEDFLTYLKEVDARNVNQPEAAS